MADLQAAPSSTPPAVATRPRAAASASPLPAPAAVVWTALAWVCVAVAVGVQIAYPLVHGGALTVVTVVSVVAIAAAVTAALAAAYGPYRALAVAGCLAAAGWAVEALGVHTGFPFGSYTYTSDLGAALASVPLVVPLAWAGMAPVALQVGRRLGHGHRAATAGLGAALLTAWDVFLDPQMIAAGRWHWLHVGASLPGVPGVPLTNFAGWLLAGTLLLAVLDRLLPRRADGSDAVLDAVLYWTYGSQLLGAIVFFGRPLVGLAGGAAMGALVLPYLWLGRR